MSSNDFTPSFYGNSFIGLLPGDTAENLIYGIVLLKSMRPESLEHDEGMGLFRLLEALHGAAHHLSMQLNAANDRKREKQAKQNLDDVADDDYQSLAAMIRRREQLKRDLQDLEIDISATPEERDLTVAFTPEELAELKAGADRAGVAPESYASTLVMERLAAMAKKGFFE
jgi:hypothetical protein